MLGRGAVLSSMCPAMARNMAFPANNEPGASLAIQAPQLRGGLKVATIQLPFDRFTPNRTDIPMDTRQLRRIGVVAIGRAFSADLSLGALRYFG